MKDRLDDFGVVTPACVQYNDDIESGNKSPSPYSNHTNKNQSPLLTSCTIVGTDNKNRFMNEPDDFDVGPTDENHNSEDTKQEVTRQKDIMVRFYEYVEYIKNDIDTITTSVRDIGDMNDRMLRITSESEEDETSAKVQVLIGETNERSKKTKDLLVRINNENNTLKADDVLKSSDMRIRENMHNTLMRKFIDEMKIYQKVQQHYKSDIRNKAERTILSVKPDATADQIDEIMRSEGGREGLVKEAILAGGVADPIKQAYTNVASKHEDVVRLEQSVAEIHQMFLDFALLTEKQGELFDQIEFNVKAAADYVEDANVDIHKSIEHQKSIRKKQCFIIIIVMVVILVIFLSIMGKNL